MDQKLKQIFYQDINQEITKKYVVDFTLQDDTLCLIEIIASAKGWWQNLVAGRSFFKDDDIIFILDRLGISSSVSTKKDVRTALNGNELKGLLKTIIVIINLKAGRHSINLIPDQSPYLKSVKVVPLLDKGKVAYEPIDNNRAQKGHSRPWFSAILININIGKIIISASVDKQSRDDDDIKVILNGIIQLNENNKSHRDWYWCGKILKGTRKDFIKEIGLKNGQFNIDIWADGRPFLYKIEVDIKEDDDNQIKLSPEYILGQIEELYKEIGAEFSISKLPDTFENNPKYENEINQAAQEFDVDPIILKATLAQESSYGKDTDHDDRYIGESGLMGLEKKNSIQQLKNLGYKFDYNKIEDVIRASAAYYKWVKSYHSKKLLRFKNQSSLLKLYTQYSSDLDAIYVNKPGIALFLYHYFYFKNQL